MKNLLFEANLKSGSIKVFENRIELHHAVKLTTLAMKGITGKIVISLKHLAGINVTPTQIIFIVPGIHYTTKEMDKIYLDNSMTFNEKKEGEVIKQLVEIIEDFI